MVGKLSTFLGASEGCKSGSQLSDKNRWRVIAPKYTQESYQFETQKWRKMEDDGTLFK